MKKWEKPEVTNLALEFTQKGSTGQGNKVICPYCCKTSNPNAGSDNAFHKGGCAYYGDRTVLVPYDGSSGCKPHES